MDQEEALGVLGRILENSRVAITIADAVGNLTLFNRAAELLTGYDRQEVLGRPISMFYDRAEDIALIQQTLAQEGKVEDLETLLVHRDGKRVPISIVVTLLADPHGEPIGSLGISMDLSERRRLEHELLEAKGRVDFYNDLMCHDIRNFSQTTGGFMQLLHDGSLGSLNDQQRRTLAICQRQVRRTGDLIRRVQTLAGLEEKGERDLRPVALAPVIVEAVEAVKERYPDRNVSVILDSIEGGCQVAASPLLFELVFNLVNNGVAHNPGSTPEVRVSLARGEGAPPLPWRLQIEDNGPGIPEEKKAAIFQRYTTRDTSGSGIGLSLVSALVRRYGGKVWAEDRVAGEPGRGSRFVAELRDGSTLAEAGADGKVEAEK